MPVENIERCEPIFKDSVFSWVLRRDSPMFGSLHNRQQRLQDHKWLYGRCHEITFRVSGLIMFATFAPLEVLSQRVWGSTKKILSHHQDIFKPTETRNQLQEIRTCTH